MRGDMATSNVSKTDVYESLYLISLSTLQIIHHLERLKAANVLRPKPAELRKLVAQQLRSDSLTSSGSPPVKSNRGINH
jgi:hypothetical protein